MVVAADGAWTPATSGVPHEPQKRWPGALAVPQFAQVAASGVPQSPQKRCPGPASLPQLEQVTPSFNPLPSRREEYPSRPAGYVCGHLVDRACGPRFDESGRLTMCRGR